MDAFDFETLRRLFFKSQTEVVTKHDSAFLPVNSPEHGRADLSLQKFSRTSPKKAATSLCRRHIFWSDKKRHGRTG